MRREGEKGEQWSGRGRYSKDGAKKKQYKRTKREVGTEERGKPKR